ncbi:MAG: hypothetical protein KGI49_02540 [Patescibacteria group bacterium]|nr:hypothetical protein [Patescibacteria group bacterium]
MKKETHRVKISGSASIELTNINWYQDEEVISSIAKYIWKHGYAYIDGKEKHEVLGRFGTRLLIRTAGFIADSIEEDLNYAYISEDERYVLAFIVGALRVRVSHQRHKDAFIDMEFNPKSEHVRFLIGERL